jgi:hypothetical protein
MQERIPQSVAKRFVFKTFLSSDHVTAGGTGLTIPVQVSKNGGGFADLATPANATSVGNGWYYIDLAAEDTNTLGPLVVRGTEATIDPAEIVCEVVAATNAGFSALPAYAAGAAGGLTAALNAIQVKTDTISAITMLGRSPAISGSNFVLYGGDSYLNADGRAINWELSHYSGPDFTASGASVVFQIITRNGEPFDSGGSPVVMEVPALVDANSTGTTLYITIDLTGEDTTSLVPDDRNVAYTYRLVGTAADLSVVTLATGFIVVHKTVEPLGSGS